MIQKTKWKKIMIKRKKYNDNQQQTWPINKNIKKYQERGNKWNTKKLNKILKTEKEELKNIEKHTEKEVKIKHTKIYWVLNSMINKWY